jgi:hypothetical protein
MLKRQDGRFLLVQTRRLRAELSKVLIEQMNEVLEIVRNLPRFRQSGIQKNANDSAYLDGALQNMKSKTKIISKVILYTTPTLKKGGERTVKELKLSEYGITFSIKQPEAVKFLNEKTLLMLSDYKGSISHTMNTKIKSIVEEGLTRGASYSELATTIREQADKGIFSRARAELIASREMGQAYEEGRKIVVDNFTSRFSGIRVQKQWLTVGDTSVTPECEANEDEGWIDENEEWSSGDDVPPRHDNPNCRCTCSRQIIDE